MHQLFQVFQEPETCEACRFNCARACSKVSFEGFRGGSKLSKGRFSGHGELEAG